MTISNYIQENETRFLNELYDFLRIPSVSTDPKFEPHILKTADFLAAKLQKAGAENIEICQTPRYPIVYADKIIDPNLPTVLVYGHYDVQPADPYDLWTTPPFEPTVRNGKVYARGASDDKGQMYLHIKAFEAMVQTDSLACNIKFMFEGEEESGSDGLAWFVEKEQERLKSDIILISDTGMISNELPSITVGLRGMSYVEVEVTGPNRDLHSGLYGGAVANPIQVLAEMITKLKDENNRITIPNFYDKVAELSAEERAEMAKIPHSEEIYRADLDLKTTDGEKGYSTIERASIRPTLDVNGIWGGYIGEGAKTVLPSKAYAKISTRLVPNQQHEEITQLIANYLQEIAPQTVTVKVTPHHGAVPAVVSTKSIAYQAASKAYETAFGVKPVPVRSGGSIPIVPMFKEKLGADSMMMGFGLDSDAIHSPDESFGIFNYLKGIETIPLFYQYFAELNQ